MDLGHGVVTPGLDDPAERLGLMELPPRLDGRTVLDIGAWDGFFSFEAERRGARRVLATDSFAWRGENWSSKEGFDLARRALGSRVEDLEIDVLDLRPERIGTFDLVLFLGVLYHLPHPLLALERVAGVAGDRLILETHVGVVGTRRPVMAFYPGTELEHDPTNWGGPNPAAVRAMLESVGFRKVTMVHPRSRAYALARGARRAGRAAAAALRERSIDLSSVRQGRVVFHAWR